MCSNFVSSTVFIATVVATYSDVCSAPQTDVDVKQSLYQNPDLGLRPLIIKAYPAIDNFQSNLYEIYAEPYIYNLRPQLAIAVIEGEEESEIKGELLFLQKRPPAGPIIIRGNITGLPAGKHGFHIHQSGDLRQGCQKLGDHFNPYFLQHGAPTDSLRHAGDLGNIEVDENGNAQIQIISSLISLFGGPRSIVGRAIVITSQADDLGRGNSADSLTTGDSGKSIACGVISYVR